jgi:hypothetical protein
VLRGDDSVTDVAWHPTPLTLSHAVVKSLDAA